MSARRYGKQYDIDKIKAAIKHLDVAEGRVRIARRGLDVAIAEAIANGFSIGTLADELGMGKTTIAKANNRGKA